MEKINGQSKSIFLDNIISYCFVQYKFKFYEYRELVVNLIYPGLSKY